MTLLTRVVARATLALCVAASTSASGQESGRLTADARRAALDKLSFLVGEWSGDAWIQLGPNDRRTMRQTERVERKLGGTALLIEGTGRAVTSDGSPGPIQFNALAVVNFDGPETYHMRSYLLDGNSGDFELKLTPKGYEWRIPLPNGQTRYTMELTADGEWVERGDFSPDGSRWFPVMEMRLRKTTPSR